MSVAAVLSDDLLYIGEMLKVLGKAHCFKKMILTMTLVLI